VSLHKDFDEDLQKVLVTNAAVEELLDEHFFVGVLHAFQEVVGVSVDSADHGVEALDALVRLLD